jgi:hypothetical protein
MKNQIEKRLKYLNNKKINGKITLKNFFGEKNNEK